MKNGPIRTITPRAYLSFFAVALTAAALLLGTSQSFSAGALKVLSPNGGQSYTLGQSLKIKWAKGNGGAKVKIVLLKGGKGYLAIAKKTANDGAFTWKIPAKVKTGGSYRIKVQSLSNTKVSDTSDKTFKIAKAKNTPAATLKVTKPNGGQKYKTGQKMAIRWNKGNAGTHVKIVLLKNGKTHKTVSRKTKNDGKYTYTIPDSIKTAKTYKIKVSSSKNAKISDTSNKTFRITKVKSSSTIKVISPNGGEQLTQGTAHTIKWNKGNGGKFVKIQLVRVVKGKDKVFRSIKGKTRNIGRLRWKVPATKAFPPGTAYKIKVSSRKIPKISDTSDKTFSIVEATTKGGGSTGGGGGGSTGGGSTGGGGGGGGNNSDPCMGEGAADCNNPGIGSGGANPDHEPGDPVVPTMSLQTPKNGDAVPHGQNVPFSFTVKDGAGYDFCIAWCVTGPAVGCPETAHVFGPFSGTASGALTFSHVTADYDAFLAVAYGFPTGAGTCISAITAPPDGLINGGVGVRGSVTAPNPKIPTYCADRIWPTGHTSYVTGGPTPCWDEDCARDSPARGWLVGTNSCDAGPTPFGCNSSLTVQAGRGFAPFDFQEKDAICVD